MNPSDSNSPRTSSDIRRRRNRRTTTILSVGVVAAMVGLSFASVPLYRIFCQATGLEGTTQVATKSPGAASGKWITVRFNADVAPGLPWSFGPEQLSVRVHPGQQTLVAYKATNHSEETTLGRATYNVTPLTVGLYFDKIQCFCFNQQSLGPGQTAELPVTFFVDPAILKDPDTKDLDTITLSYTFFAGKNANGLRTSAVSVAPGVADHTDTQRPVNTALAETPPKT